MMSQDNQPTSNSHVLDVSLIDVTLRDGGYRNKFNFPEEVVNEVIINADTSGMEYIEVGYRNGMWATSTGLGPTGLCAKDYLVSCRRLINFAKMTVMFHPKNVQPSDLEEMRACGVDCLRISFPMDDYDLGFRYLALAKTLGFEVFVNLVHLSERPLDELDTLVGQIAAHEPYGIGLADSNGNMTPDQVAKVFSFITQKYNKVAFCLHAHDNLFLAQANAWAAITNGARYIDGTFSGYGRGVGNLRTEGIVALLRSLGCMK